MERFKDFNLKAKAGIWPGLSYVCHIRSIVAPTNNQFNVRAESMPKPSTPSPKTQTPTAPNLTFPDPNPKTANAQQSLLRGLRRLHSIGVPLSHFFITLEPRVE